MSWREHFEKRLAKTGYAMTARQLVEWARRNKVPHTPADIHDYLRNENPVTAAFAKRRLRPRTYQTMSVIKPGIYFLDYGEFHKEWAGSNGGATGFLVAAENVTNRLFALPTRGKDTRQWLDSIARFVELTRNVQVVYTDRDSVATSPRFREQIMQDYGISWHFLRKGHKSFLAERYIGFVKQKLVQACKALDTGKRWVDHLPAICKGYNESKIPGTSYTRQSVDRNNFDHFAGQLFGDRNYDLRMNAFGAGPFEQDAWNRRIFKFDLGDKVLVSRAADWRLVGSGGAYKKPSMQGTFDPDKVRTVVGRQLRADKAYKTMVPVYALAEFEGHFHFYEHELVAAAKTRR